jgi:hypothetical protein
MSKSMLTIRKEQYAVLQKVELEKFVGEACGHLMILFGQDFDTDEHLKWANQILNSENPSVTKIEMLITKAKRQLKES